MVARWLLGLVVVGSLVACAAPPPDKAAPAAKKAGTANTGSTHDDGAEKAGTLKATTGKPLEAPDDDGKTASKMGGGDDVPLPTPRPKSAGDDDDDSTTTTPATPDAPPPDADPTSTAPICDSLWLCCANLRDAGYTDKANACDSTALAMDNLSCDVANEAYKTSDGDYTAACH